MLNLSARETILLGLYYRSIGFCRTATQLKSAVHQQSLTSAERSVIELCVDMELIHRNAIPDAVEKFDAFTDVQKLRAARRIDRFFAENPELDSAPSSASVHREFTRTTLLESKHTLSGCGERERSQHTGVGRIFSTAQKSWARTSHCWS
jgi:hypothetical protein